MTSHVGVEFYFSAPFMHQNLGIISRHRIGSLRCLAGSRHHSVRHASPGVTLPRPSSSFLVLNSRSSRISLLLDDVLEPFPFESIAFLYRNGYAQRNVGFHENAQLTPSLPEINEVNTISKVNTFQPDCGRDATVSKGR
jgi:hypothetical protein